MRWEELHSVRYLRNATVHVDTAGTTKLPTKIIVVGERGQDFVRVFEVYLGTIEELIDLLVGAKLSGVQIGRIDAPADMGAIIRAAVAQRTRVSPDWQRQGF